jgi:hypothetical protein
MVYSREINLPFYLFLFTQRLFSYVLYYLPAFFHNLSSWFAFLMIAYTAAHNTSPTESPCLVSRLTVLMTAFCATVVANIPCSFFYVFLLALSLPFSF